MYAWHERKDGRGRCGVCFSDSYFIVETKYDEQWSDGNISDHYDSRREKPSVLVTSPGSPDLHAQGRSRHTRHPGGNANVGGRLQVKLGFDTTRLQLIVILVCAAGLTPRGNGQPRNPYAKTFLLPDKRYVYLYSTSGIFSRINITDVYTKLLWRLTFYWYSTGLILRVVKNRNEERKLWLILTTRSGIKPSFTAGWEDLSWGKERWKSQSGTMKGIFLDKFLLAMILSWVEYFSIWFSRLWVCNYTSIHTWKKKRGKNFQILQDEKNHQFEENIWYGCTYDHVESDQNQVISKISFHKVSIRWFLTRILSKKKILFDPFLLSYFFSQIRSERLPRGSSSGIRGISIGRRAWMALSSCPRGAAQARRVSNRYHYHKITLRIDFDDLFVVRWSVGVWG